MTPEEREARRKQMEERMKNMSPEERAQFEERMRNRGNREGGGRGTPGAPQGQRTGREGGNQNRQTPAPRQAETGSALSRTNAQTIDALFAPVVRPDVRSRVWLYINKQLKSVAVRTGVTDGTWTEIIDSPEMAQLQPNTEVVLNVVTGLEPANRPGQQGGQGNPLMPQRGQPGRGGPGGGGRGR